MQPIPLANVGPLYEARGISIDGLTQAHLNRSAFRINSCQFTFPLPDPVPEPIHLAHLYLAIHFRDNPQVYVSTKFDIDNSLSPALADLPLNVQSALWPYIDPAQLDPSIPDEISRPGSHRKAYGRDSGESSTRVAVRGTVSAGGGLTKDEVDALIEAALANFTPGLTENQVNALIQNAIAGISTGGLTQSQVQALIDASLPDPYVLPDAADGVKGGVYSITNDVFDTGTHPGVFGYTINALKHAIHTIVPTWARSGNATLIPSTKLQLPDNIPTESEALAIANQAIFSHVYDWARDPNTDPIPAEKLVNAPSGGGGTNTGIVQVLTFEGDNGLHGASGDPSPVTRQSLVHLAITPTTATSYFRITGQCRMFYTWRTGADRDTTHDVGGSFYIYRGLDTSNPTHSFGTELVYQTNQRTRLTGTQISATPSIDFDVIAIDRPLTADTVTYSIDYNNQSNSLRGIWNDPLIILEEIVT